MLPTLSVKLQDRHVFKHLKYIVFCINQLRTGKVTVPLDSLPVFPW